MSLIFLFLSYAIVPKNNDYCFELNKVVKAHKRIKKMVKVSLDNVKLLVDVDKEPFFKPSSTTVGDILTKDALEFIVLYTELSTTRENNYWKTDKLFRRN